MHRKFQPTALLTLLLVLLLGVAPFVMNAGDNAKVGSTKAATQQNDASYIRPGIIVKLTSAAIADDGTITAGFTITDPKGVPLDREGIETAGEVDVRLNAAVIPAGQTKYLSYTTTTKTAPNNGKTVTQGGYDRGGTFAKVGDGKYTYTFKTKAPAGFDKTATHTVGILVERDLYEFDLGMQGMDAVMTFVPDGSAVKTVRNIMDAKACNACHDPMSGHGGTRLLVETCDLCHNPQTVNPDSGNTMDMTVMTHKIHMGKNLPSVKAGGKYTIPHRGAVNDFSGVGFPADLTNCVVCHQPGSKQQDAWKTATREACGSCHDNVNFATGENHANLPQVDDKLCNTCHGETDGKAEYDLSVRGAHTTARFSKQLPGVVISIVKVDDGAPGKSPTVTFTVKDRSGKALLPADMSRINVVIAGPTSDYSVYASEAAITKVKASSDGTYTYTMAYKIPADAKGTFTIGLEGRRDIKLNAGTKKEVVQRDAAINVQTTFSVDGSPVAARRQVVSIDKCNACHTKLALHGENRNTIEQCVLCHNPNTVTKATDTVPAESVDFRTMIHKIHQGDRLTVSYQVGSSNYTEVGYPADTRDCQKCHVNGSEQLPLQDSLINVQTPHGYSSTTGPTSAACLACHTTKPAASHALANTTALGESCAACHGPSSDFSVNKSHSKPLPPD